MRKWPIAAAVVAAAAGSALTWAVLAGPMNAQRSRETALASAMDSTRQQVLELSRLVGVLQDSLARERQRQRAQADWEAQLAEERAIREEAQAIREGIEAEGGGPARWELMRRLQGEAMGK